MNICREYFIAMWIIPGCKQTYTHFIKFFILYWLNAYLSTQPIYWVMNAFINKSKMPSPSNLWYIQFTHTHLHMNIKSCIIKIFVLIWLLIKMPDWGRAFTNSNLNDMVGTCRKLIQSKTIHLHINIKGGIIKKLVLILFDN